MGCFMNKNRYLEVLDCYSDMVYGLPMFIVLLTKSPDEFIRNIKEKTFFEFMDKDVKENAIKILYKTKEKIEMNFLLSNDALLDLIETVTKRNITDQTVAKIKSSNKNYTENLLKLEDGEYKKYKGSLDNRQNNIKTLSGLDIGVFNLKKGKKTYPNERTSNIFNFPYEVDGKLLNGTFFQLSDEKKKRVIEIILSNLQLCYDFYKEYYLNEKAKVIPTKIILSNKEVIDYDNTLDEKNIPHLLGIPKFNDIPMETRKILLKNGNERRLFNEERKYGNSLAILKLILDRKERIIEHNGVIKVNGKEYGLLPWERILLKENAFIRGDFFKKTAYMCEKNDDAYLNNKNENIDYVSLTATNFNDSIFKQKESNLEDLNQILKKSNPNIPIKNDYVVKGLVETEGGYVPITNTSYIGEKLSADGEILPTLNNPRNLVDFESEEGGIIVKVSNGNHIYTPSPTEQIEALVNAALLGAKVDAKVIKDKINQEYEIEKQEKLAQIQRENEHAKNILQKYENENQIKSKKTQEKNKYTEDNFIDPDIQSDTIKKGK